MDLDGRKALTVNEFAACTGLSRATVYRLIDNGQLKHFRFGGSRYLIPMTEVDRITNEATYRKQEARADKPVADLCIRSASVPPDVRPRP